MRRTLSSLTVPCFPSSFTLSDDDVGLHVLGCRVDILGTNCNKTVISLSLFSSLVYIYIYIYRERERERERGGGGGIALVLLLRDLLYQCNKTSGTDKKVIWYWG